MFSFLLFLHSESNPHNPEQIIRHKFQELMKQRRDFESLNGPLSPDDEKAFREKELQIHLELASLRSSPSSDKISEDSISALISEIESFVKISQIESDYDWLMRERKYIEYIERLRAVEDSRANWLEVEFLKEKRSRNDGRSEKWAMMRLGGIMVGGIVGGMVICGRLVLRKFKRRKSDEGPRFLLG
jgi:hypothetical protein